MANSRVIRNRIKSVKNTGKITKTMAMVATAKATKAVAQIRNSKPYSEKIRNILSLLAGDADAHPLLSANPKAARKLLLVVTANRGLCGGYNANVIRQAIAVLDKDTDVIMFGKKGMASFRYQKIPVKKAVTSIQDVPSFAGIQETADEVMAAFTNGEYASVKVAYTRFFSAGRQKAVLEQLLPLQISTDGTAETGSEPIFIPGKEALVRNLVPRAVRMTLFRYFLDAAASEQLARQMAMSSASDNALDMVKKLTLSYNRARQAQITTEISEIVGGAEALN